MNISVLQHAEAEGPGEIEAWAHERLHHVAVTRLWLGEALPVVNSFDLLVVMGGEMNIYEYRDWPWLKLERELIETSLANRKPVVGICLGAQLIADALGSRVAQNPQFELGWHPVAWTDEARAFCPEVGAATTVLHWHGDAFELPQGAIRLAMSEGCPEQGFLIPGTCLALQFHAEVNAAHVGEFIQTQNQWPEGPYVQTPERIIAQAGSFHPAMRDLLFALLDRFCGK